MKVKVMAFASIREKLGWREKEISFDGTEVGDLLKAIKTTDGRSLYEILCENEELKPNYLILLNGREIEYLNGLKTKIRDGDTIQVFPPAGGG